MIDHIGSYFSDLSAGLSAFLRGREVYTAAFSAEQSDFVRLNHAKVRQAGHVSQTYLSLRLLDGLPGEHGAHHASSTFSLSGDLENDLARCRDTFATLRGILPDLPADPHFSINTDALAKTPPARHRGAALPDARAMTESIMAAAGGLDLVGFLASGPLQRGFSNSLGQHNWHEVSSFNLEWSLYQHSDKAVKSSYAGLHWDHEILKARMEHARTGLEILQRPAMTLPPGSYRAYLTPAALAEIIGIINWGGFSAKGRATRQSPLQKLAEGGASFSPLVHISENIAAGLAPAFQSSGYARPDHVDLITAGRNVNALVAPRTAREYGLQQNGANDGEEMAQSLDMAAGTLAQADILRELGTGLYINNLWYLNYSDRMNGRITGMTRFATFWVENGEIVAPCNVMRFDDSIYRILGGNLLALTQERELIPDSITYNERMTQSMRLPGALSSSFMLTL